ncbi:hypothetical protein FIBSPDRAFT_891568 [Athelia psychrophila]|uniref:Uncharacterized protein n=1 Tax=Athelia psychrophila TaxID=1759441 RepID=A0A166JKT1_9AGAM|nr:hypothetical protein FIBSPDRAFT_891568 [Fibularhizoctonia sp. CBS 109695]
MTYNNKQGTQISITLLNFGGGDYLSKKATDQAAFQQRTWSVCSSSVALLVLYRTFDVATSQQLSSIHHRCPQMSAPATSNYATSNVHNQGKVYNVNGDCTITNNGNTTIINIVNNNYYIVQSAPESNQQPPGQTRDHKVHNEVHDIGIKIYTNDAYFHALR